MDMTLAQIGTTIIRTMTEWTAAKKMDL
jgi:hypothetical protein